MKWKQISMSYGLESRNSFNIKGKNSTDIQIVVDIMEDLYF